jgi:hypothetical protein
MSTSRKYSVWMTTSEHIPLPYKGQWDEAAWGEGGWGKGEWGAPPIQHGKTLGSG